jgi:osmotically-inducible protein OsmY
MSMITDADIQDNVQHELRWDSRVDPADIGVAVTDGVVTLTGTVKSFAERTAAQQAALRVAGVRDLANDVLVQVPGHLVRTDADIAQAVRAALEWDVLVPSDLIQITVSEGVVTLMGAVESGQQVADAERAVGNLAGVQDVVSELVVHAPHVDASAVQAEIEHALERRADAIARRIRVVVHDSTVTLNGSVHSWAEKEAVLAAASFTHGVRGVEDHLHLEHPGEIRARDEHLHAQLPL